MKKFLSILLTFLTILQIGVYAEPLGSTADDNQNHDGICVIRLLNDEMVIYVPHDQIKPFFKLLKIRNTCCEALRHPATKIASHATAWGLQIAGSVAVGKAVSRIAEKTWAMSSTAASLTECGVGILTYLLLDPLEERVARTPSAIAERLGDCCVLIDNMFISSSARVVNSEFQQDPAGQTTWCDPEYLLNDLGIDNPVPGRDRWTDLDTGIIITVGGRSFDPHGIFGGGHHAYIYRAPSVDESNGQPPRVIGAQDDELILDTFFGDLNGDSLAFRVNQQGAPFNRPVTEVYYTDKCDNDLYAQLCR